MGMHDNKGKYIRCFSIGDQGKVPKLGVLWKRSRGQMHVLNKLNIKQFMKLYHQEEAMFFPKMNNFIEIYSRKYQKEKVLE